MNLRALKVALAQVAQQIDGLLLDTVEKEAVAAAQAPPSTNYPRAPGVERKP